MQVNNHRFTQQQLHFIALVKGRALFLDPYAENFVVLDHKIKELNTCIELENAFMASLLALAITNHVLNPIAWALRRWRPSTLFSNYLIRNLALENLFFVAVTCFYEQPGNYPEDITGDLARNIYHTFISASAVLAINLGYDDSEQVTSMVTMLSKNLGRAVWPRDLFSAAKNHIIGVLAQDCWMYGYMASIDTLADDLDLVAITHTYNPDMFLPQEIHSNRLSVASETSLLTRYGSDLMKYESRRRQMHGPKTTMGAPLLSPQSSMTPC